MKTLVQVWFIAGLLGAAGALAAESPATTNGPSTNGKGAPTAVDASGPSQLIESSANVILSGIDARRAEFRKDPTGLYQLVETTLLPHFDTPYAAQLVLGQHWRNATPE
ncbi:MAG TPA: ABC transporter substrate-binding protein, partial [Steroidobacteraceae bacterium]|nr:ABC transporter substrate-binding protein [Steroidobacteraceae bacterium]